MGCDLGAIPRVVLKAWWESRSSLQIRPQETVFELEIAVKVVPPLTIPILNPPWRVSHLKREGTTLTSSLSHDFLSLKTNWGGEGQPRTTYR